MCASSPPGPITELSGCDGWEFVVLLLLTKEVCVVFVKITPGGRLCVLIVSEDTIDPMFMKRLMNFFGVAIIPLSDSSART